MAESQNTTRDRLMPCRWEEANGEGQYKCTHPDFACDWSGEVCYSDCCCYEETPPPFEMDNFEFSDPNALVTFLGRCEHCGEYIEVEKEAHYEICIVSHVCKQEIPSLYGGFNQHHNIPFYQITCYKHGDPDQYHPVYHIRPFQLCPCCHYIEIHDALAAQGKACSYCQEGQRVAHEINRYEYAQHTKQYYISDELMRQGVEQQWKKIPLPKETAVTKNKVWLGYFMGHRAYETGYSLIL